MHFSTHIATLHSTFSLLVKQLAIRLGYPKTIAKSLVMAALLLRGAR